MWGGKGRKPLLVERRGENGIFSPIYLFCPYNSPLDIPIGILPSSLVH
jgi:hypothetical protein